MYEYACKFDGEIIFYFDAWGNKYVVSGGNLAWRLNNPGLVRSHSHFAGKNCSIGSCDGFAIFPDPQMGRKALCDWLNSKKYSNSNLKTLAAHYEPLDPDSLILKISSLTGISNARKLGSLNKNEFDLLVKVIEKNCGYDSLGNESIVLLPKITAKIENGANQEDTYLIGDSVILSRKDAIDWILAHRLDGVIVHGDDGLVHLRSRPNHCFLDVKISRNQGPPLETQIDTLIRTVGEQKQDQCVWGFINGIRNSKEEALESARLISTAAGGEKVLSMPNDSALFGLQDLFACGALKASIDLPIIGWAVKFFRHLLAVAAEQLRPVIVFVHSQGAIISEHALEILAQSEREKLRIFTFGGGSFLLPGKCHPDSHNYASAADYVCRMASPKLQHFALLRYFGQKEGYSEQQVIRQLAFQDAMLDLNSIDPAAIEAYKESRVRYYESEFFKISNVTVLDPDPDSNWEHTFFSDCYQTQVQAIVKKYQAT